MKSYVFSPSHWVAMKRAVARAVTPDILDSNTLDESVRPQFARDETPTIVGGLAHEAIQMAVLRGAIVSRGSHWTNTAAIDLHTSWPD